MNLFLITTVVEDTNMGFADKLRNEVCMIRNITKYLEKEEAKIQQITNKKKDVCVQTNLI